ncbi:MAG: hypothetical protein AVDCRST_MAG85-498, partial [uncultured Solirubrobacteraceae bacterium]
CAPAASTPRTTGWPSRPSSSTPKAKRARRASGTPNR